MPLLIALRTTPEHRRVSIALERHDGSPPTPLRMRHTSPRHRHDRQGMDRFEPEDKVRSEGRSDRPGRRDNREHHPEAVPWVRRLRRLVGRRYRSYLRVLELAIGTLSTRSRRSRSDGHPLPFPAISAYTMSPQGTVTLRDVIEADLPVFFEFERDPVSNEMAAFPARDREAFMQHWTVNILGNDTGRKRTVLLDGEVVGNMLSWEQSGDTLVGYWIGREYWGKGVATRALTLFLTEVDTRPLHAHVVSTTSAPSGCSRSAGSASLARRRSRSRGYGSSRSSSGSRPIPHAS
jgi:RimJ/RimL family protein N-acetyltransferase